MHLRYQDKDESEIPKELLDEPVLLEGLSFYYEAFWELFSDRQLGMGTGPIPSSSLRNFCIDYQLDEDMTFTFKKLIRKMDAVFLEWQDNQSKKNQKIKKSK